jgi:hypothetical protein
LVILPKKDLETPLKKIEFERDFYLKRRKWNGFCGIDTSTMA